MLAQVNYGGITLVIVFGALAVYLLVAFSDKITKLWKKKRVHNPPSSNRSNMSDIEKTVFTFLLAIAIPGMLSLVAYTLHRNLYAFLAVWVAVSAYVLYFGYNRNGEQERSVGGVFNQLTTWVIPSGISWWFPWPLGQSLRKRSIEKIVTDSSGNEKYLFEEVVTSDGAPVSVEVTLTWGINEMRKAALYSQEGLIKEAEAILDRGVRLFALHFKSDPEELGDKFEDVLAHQKVNFSKYLIGDKTIVDPQGKKIPNDIQEKLAEAGISFYGATVTNINPPKSALDAREKASAEAAEAEAEKRDIESIRNRTLEMMWGTSKEKEIQGKKEAGEKPLMPYEEALRAVRAARKDLEDINVSGNAGDFTKGAGLGRKERA